MSTAPRFDFNRFNLYSATPKPKKRCARPPEPSEVTAACEQYQETRKALAAARMICQQALKRNREA